MKTLPIYTVGERLPANGEVILQFINSSTYGVQDLHVVFSEVNYVWEEFDEDGYPTGSGILYDEKTNDVGHPPEGCRLVLQVVGGILGPNSKYATSEDVQKLMEKETQ